MGKILSFNQDYYGWIEGNDLREIESASKEIPGTLLLSGLGHIGSIDKYLWNRTTPVYHGIFHCIRKDNRVRPIENLNLVLQLSPLRGRERFPMTLKKEVPAMIEYYTTQILGEDATIRDDLLFMMLKHYFRVCLDEADRVLKPRKELVEGKEMCKIEPVIIGAALYQDPRRLLVADSKKWDPYIPL